LEFKLIFFQVKIALFDSKPKAIKKNSTREIYTRKRETCGGGAFHFCQNIKSKKQFLQMKI